MTMVGVHIEKWGLDDQLYLPHEHEFVRSCPQTVPNTCCCLQNPSDVSTLPYSEYDCASVLRWNTESSKLVSCYRVD